MADKPQAGVLASLPRTRPHRRSAKRSPAGLAQESAQAPAEPTPTEAKFVPAKPKRPAKTAAKARTAKTAAAKPADKARTAKARTTKGAAAKPAGKGQTASQTRRAPAAQSGRGHHTQPRTQAPRPAGGKPPAPDPATGPLGTAVQAAAELAEIGMMASARALRGALSRLPRP
jgi:hypothetical protein